MIHHRFNKRRKQNLFIVCFTWIKLVWMTKSERDEDHQHSKRISVQQGLEKTSCLYHNMFYKSEKGTSLTFPSRMKGQSTLEPSVPDMALALESLFHPQETSTKQFHLEKSQFGSLVRQKIFSYYDRWRNQPNMSPTMNVSREWCRAMGTSWSRGEKSSCTYWFLSVTTGKGISSIMSSRSSVRLLAREMSIDVLWSGLCFTVGKK